MRVALVARYAGYRSYSCELLTAIDNLLGPGDIMIPYGPKTERRCLCPLPVKGVWSPLLHPFQVLRQALKDRIELVHVEFEFVTFGAAPSLLTCWMLFLCRIAGVKSVVTLHGPIFPPRVSAQAVRQLLPSGSRIPTRIAKAYVTAVYLVLSKLSSLTLVHADVFARWLATGGVGPLEVIRHGVPKKPQSFGANGRPETGRAVLFFGHIAPRKGIESLIRAFRPVAARFSDLKLVIAGTTPSYYRGYEKLLAETVRQEGLESSVLFNTDPSDNEIDHLFRTSIFLVLPYSYSISASGPLALAISYEKAIIATRTEFFCEQLKDQADAYLVPPDDQVALSEGLLRLLEDERLRTSLAENAKLLGKEISWKRIAVSTLAAYRRVLGSSKTHTAPDPTIQSTGGNRRP